MPAGIVGAATGRLLLSEQNRSDQRLQSRQVNSRGTQVRFRTAASGHAEGRMYASREDDCLTWLSWYLIAVASSLVAIFLMGGHYQRPVPATESPTLYSILSGAAF